MDDELRMLELARQNFCCSQILLILGLEAQGKVNPDLVRTMDALCGGMGNSGETCGTLIGGACVLGLYAGRGAPEEPPDDRLNGLVMALVEWFDEQYGRLYGSIRCEAILAGDPRARVTRCPGIVAATWQKVKELLVEHGFDLSGEV